MKMLAHLSRFAASDGKDNMWREKPFSLKVKKDTWSVATDGCMLFAVKIPGVFPGIGFPEVLREMLTVDAKDPTEVSIMDLKSWCGEVPTDRVDTTAEVPEEVRGVVLRCTVDRRKLAYLISHITLPRVLVWPYKKEALVIEAPKGQWRLFLAPLDGSPVPSEPVFGTQKAPDPMTASELMELAGAE